MLWVSTGNNSAWRLVHVKAAGIFSFVISQVSSGASVHTATCQALASLPWLSGQPWCLGAERAVSSDAEGECF